MDDKTQKERIEQELRFLKESFEAEVISKGEFEKGKERLEKKLKEIEKSAKEHDEEIKEDVNKDIKAEEQKKNEAIVNKEDEKIRLKVIQDEVHNGVHEHNGIEPSQKIEQEVVKEATNEKPAEVDEVKKQNKFFKYAVVFVVLTLIIFFSYYLLKNNNEVNNKEVQEKIVEVKSNPIAKINVVILNDRKNCFNCDTQRVLGILEHWFGGLNVKEIDYNTEEGKSIAEKFNAKLLPMYILDESITNSSSFEQFRQVFVKKDNHYILRDDAAGSTFYFMRDNIQNKLDLFVISGDNTSIRAEKNLKEFFDAFKEVSFNKHTSEDELTKELAIKNFPTFLINNRVKFSGVHATDTIKENFCKMNELEGCGKSLSKSLV